METQTKIQEILETQVAETQVAETQTNKRKYNEESDYTEYEYGSENKRKRVNVLKSKIKEIDALTPAAKDIFLECIFFFFFIFNFYFSDLKKKQKN